MKKGEAERCETPLRPLKKQHAPAPSTRRSNVIYIMHAQYRRIRRKVREENDQR